ncbi:unnamed protein product [Aspergillus oryzae]|uniref:Unnamed protein product n=3 Tax=Aspergillus oryzae TaxID=5062 RepID=A0AAN4YWK8_ASPOZ|nr:unnamed protein product [Aspergillus oryzae]
MREDKSSKIPKMLSSVLLVLFSAAVGAKTVPNGQTLTLNGIPYYLSGIPISNFSHNVFDKASNDVDIFPFTVIQTSSTVHSSFLSETVANFTQQDDVFQPAFLQTVYLTSSVEASQIDELSGSEALHQFDNKMFLTESDASLSTPLPNGPYFASARTGHIFRAYRLYSDDSLAFISAAISDESGGFIPMTGVTEGVMTKNVAVPSRLYYTPTAEKPLAGLRLAVKDIFHIKGLRTSGGSRAYYYLYDEQNVTTPSVQRLFDLGAVMVGKVGTVQFANGDRPTADWVDLHCPFNPRGDGYQYPSGSSSGSGAAIAAYEWLDLAIGSDTGGSMRGPAGVQGIYGNRPSTGAITLEHALPLSPPLDTAGMFARSASLWSKTVQAWYPNFNRSYPSHPKQLYLSHSNWDESTAPEANEHLETFMQRLEDFLDTNRTIVNVTERWSETHNSPSLINLLNTTYAYLVGVGQWNNLAKGFFADYAQAHDGRRPFINPGPLARWEWGQANGGNASYDAALHNMTVFRDWWSTSGYGRSDDDSCSEGIFVHAWATGAADYRNRYFNPPGPPFGFTDDAIAVFAGAPEVVVPLGESPYNSTITLHEEYLPVSIGLQMARGCDRALAELVDDLGKAGILKPVSAGSRLYS